MFEEENLKIKSRFGKDPFGSSYIEISLIYENRTISSTEIFLSDIKEWVEIEE